MGKGEHSSIAILEYADALVETLRNSIPDAIKSSEPKAVHQARVTTRRLKAAVDVFQLTCTGKHRKDFARILNKLRKSLGPLRDLDVMLLHLAEFKSDRHKLAIDLMKERLGAQQVKARECAIEVVDVAKVLARLGVWWGVREEWSAADAALHTLLAESLHLQADRFTELADALAGRTGADLSRSAPDPHQLRIAGKALRYTLELAVAGGHNLPPAVMRSFKRMQEALGLWHDFVVLNDRLLETVIGHHDSAAVLSALSLAKDSVRHSQKQLATFVRLWNRRGEALLQSIRQAFPLTQPADAGPVNEMQMDPDHCDSASSPAAPRCPDVRAAPVSGETSAA